MNNLLVEFDSMYLCLGGGKDWADHKWADFEFSKIKPVSISVLAISEMELRIKTAWVCEQEEQSIGGLFGLIGLTKWVVTDSATDDFTYGYIEMINGQEYWLSETDYNRVKAASDAFKFIKGADLNDNN